MKIKKIFSLIFSASMMATSSLSYSASAANVAFVGNTLVGKTSILNKIVLGKNTDIRGIDGTLGAALRVIKYSNDGVEHFISVNDIGGLERFRSVAPTYIKNALMSIVVASIDDDDDSIKSVPEWIDMCFQHSSPNSTVMLVVNKFDLDNNKINDNIEKLSNIASNKGIGIIFISALNGDGIEELKNKIIEVCHPLMTQGT